METLSHFAVDGASEICAVPPQSHADSLEDKEIVDSVEDEEIVEPVPVVESTSPSPRRAGWYAYALGVPCTVLFAELLWMFRDPIATRGQWALDLAYRWIGPSLVLPFALLLATQLASVWGFVRRRDRPAPARLTAGGLMEFAVGMAPIVGLLGTVLGFAEYFATLDGGQYGGLVTALGTTAVGMSMVAVGQTARLLLSPDYRRVLNSEAGDDAGAPSHG